MNLYYVKQILSPTSIIFLQILIIIILFLNRIRKNWKFYVIASKLQGPTAIPGFGNEWSFLFRKNRIFDDLVKYSKKYGSRYRLWLNNHLFIVLSTAQDVKEVFLNPRLLDKGPLFCNSFGKSFGKGLFSTQVLDWKVKRKLVLYSMKNNVLQNYVHDMNVISGKLVDTFKRLAKNKKEFDAWDFVPVVPYNIVCKTLFGFDNLDDHSKFYKIAVPETLGFDFEAIILPKIYSWAIRIIKNKWFKRTREEMKVAYNKVKSMNTYVKDMYISDRSKAASTATDKTFKNFVELISTSDYYTEQDIMDEIITFTTGGSETTSIVMCFVLLMLALHPDVQDKVYDEMCDVFHDDSDYISIENAHKLKYLGQVIKETQRLFPLVPFQFRYANEDVTIGKFKYPKGTYFIANVYAIHRESCNFTSPEEFNPDRFLPEISAHLPKGTSMEFGLGPRDCIGKAFALLEMNITLSKILRKFRVETRTKMEDIKLVCKFVSSNVNGFHISLSERSRKSL